MESRRTFSKLLRITADLLERSAPSDIERLIEGRARLVILTANSATSPSDAKRPRDPEKRRRPDSRDFAATVDQLRMLASREAGFKLLIDLHLVKRELEALARLMDLPVVREDDAEQLRRKIVEESIGARLNSQAIRGR
jgi:hypothetical protein